MRTADVWVSLLGVTLLGLLVYVALQAREYMVRRAESARALRVAEEAAAEAEAARVAAEDARVAAEQQAAAAVQAQQQTLAYASLATNPYYWYYSYPYQAYYDSLPLYRPRYHYRHGRHGSPGHGGRRHGSPGRGR
jgi:hypothetical protein